jgi:uncharacterized protein
MPFKAKRRNGEYPNFCKPACPRSRQVGGFFSRLGFTFNAQFTDKNRHLHDLSEDIFVMLLTREKFANFTPKEICDATKATKVLICLSRESRKSVDDMVAAAISAGGKSPMPPKDYGFMYQHGFEDPAGTYGSSSTWSRARQAQLQLNSR